MKRALVLAGVAAVGAVAAGVGVAVVACDSPDNHLLIGELYTPGQQCLGVPAAVDDLAGADPGETCTPECLTTSQSGATQIFVTTTCPPYSPQYRQEIQDAAHDSADPCFQAFAIYVDGSICGALTDAAPEAAGPDGGADGAADGATDAGDAGDGGVEAGGDAEAGADAAGDADAGGG